jgi:hypothetical protein
VLSKGFRLFVLLASVVLAGCGSRFDSDDARAITSPTPIPTDNPEPEISPLRPGGAVEPLPSGLPTAGPPPAEPTPGPSVFVPPAGRYVYATSGTWHSGRQSGEVPPRQIADVAVQRQGNTTEVTATYHFQGEEGRQTLVAEVTDTQARLVSLGSSSGDGLLSSELSVKPDPPAVMARLPYVVGDEWEISWQDRALGVQAVGTGKILRRETVDTGIGPLDTVVIEVRQRLAGAASGELTITFWIDPATGIQAQLHTISHTEGVGGSNGSDVLATLQEGP